MFTLTQEDGVDEHWVVKVDKSIHTILHGRDSSYSMTLQGLANTCFWTHYILATDVITKAKTHRGQLWFQGMPNEGHNNYGAMINQVVSWLKRPRFAPTENTQLSALQQRST